MNLLYFFKKKKDTNTSEYLKHENAVLIDPPNNKSIEVPVEVKPVEQRKEKRTLESLSKEIIEFYVMCFAEKELEEELSHEPDYFPRYKNLVDKDPLFDEAARLIVVHQQGSTSLIQRKFSIGYNRAGLLMDQLEAVGIVGVALGSRSREVFIADEYILEKLLDSLRNVTEIPLYYGLSQELRDEIRIKFEDSILLKKDEMKIEFYRNKKEMEETEIDRQKEIIRRELIEKEKIRQLRKEVKKELVESGHIQQERKRESIPQDIQDKVWVRDGGKCVSCGSCENLEFDHIIPFSKGGSNSYRNIQLLCEKCNRQKSNKIG